MNIYLIEDYVRRLNKSDVERFALKQGIVFDRDEIDIVYNYISRDCKYDPHSTPLGKDSIEQLFHYKSLF